MDKIWVEMYKKAKSVQNSRDINGYISAGGVAAAVLDDHGGTHQHIVRDGAYRPGAGRQHSGPSLGSNVDAVMGAPIPHCGAVN